LNLQGWIPMKMRNVLFGAICAVVATLSMLGAALPIELTPKASDADVGPYHGYAISKDGRIFRSENPVKDGVLARNNIKTECEKKAGGICEAFSINFKTLMVAIYCKDGARQGGFLGAERQQSAMENALEKAFKADFLERQCVSVYSNVVARGNC
jgi:hypothetical protein